MNGRAQAPATAVDAQAAGPRIPRLEDLLLPLLTGTLALLVYALTLAPDLTWAHFGGDGGELITAAATLGIPHPPGYPTYVLLGKLVSLLPLGSAAWRFNLFSAVCASTAAAFVTATARSSLAGRRYRDIAALAAGLTTAFTPLIWSQAVISEVYALNLAMLAIFLWSLLSARSPIASGLFLGLSVTTHLTSLLMVPLALLLTPRQGWTRLALGVLVGLLPLLALPLLARTESPVIWGDPRQLAGWWQLVSGRLYHANLALPQAGQVGSTVARVGDALLRQFAWAGWLLVVLGVAGRLLSRRVTIGLLVSALLYLAYAFLYRTDDAALYLLPVLLLLAPLLAAGLSKAGVWSLLLPAALLLVGFRAADLSGERTLRPLAETALDSAPPQALLLTAGDSSIFALWYFQHVEQMRQDVVLVDSNLLAFSWYRERLRAQYPRLLGLEGDDLRHFRAANGRVRLFCDVPPELKGPLICRSET